MAYFIVIGTNNDVKDVVDEVKRAHLQHNVITSGCILSEDDALYYHWDVFNEKGDKTKESNEQIVLHDALTNQISQFRTLLPDDAVPNVFIVARCFDKAQSETLQMVCEELYQIGGAKLSGLQVDIVLVGYDLSKPEDVTIRPHWRLLETLRGLGEGGRFHTNILYLNNMDYMGAATNVDSHILCKFLCHWSKMVCAGGYDPKATVQSNVYSIGMSEYQYDFRDLNEFFKLSAEERLLDRTLNSSPSSDTQELIDTNYYKKIDLSLPWIDGLCSIKASWEEYCSSDWNPSRPISENVYSVSRQEMELASYLNSFLKLYISEELREIDILNAEIGQKQREKEELLLNIDEVNATEEAEDTKEEPINSINARITEIDAVIEKHNQSILQYQRNIAKNTFLDADSFQSQFGTIERITEEDEAAYAANKLLVEQLTSYVKSEDGIGVMRSAIERATVEDTLPEPYPASSILNIGRLKAIALDQEKVPSIPAHSTTLSEEDSLKERPGCLFWFKNLFGKKSSEEQIDSLESSSFSISRPTPIDQEAINFLKDALSKAVSAMRRAEEVREWWNTLCSMVERYQIRRAECRLLMDGEQVINEQYISGKEGYIPRDHKKSRTLIEMKRVRDFRDNNTYYKQNIDKFLSRWFDKNIEPDKRMTMPELIKHQVLDALSGRFHTLLWDGSNPFVQEDISDYDMHKIIEHNIRQSKPFVEYVRIQESNIASNLNIGFFSNKPDIPTDATEFKSKFNVSPESISPVFLEDFVNSLCVIQVLDIPEHVDSLKDFKPKRDTELSRLRTDIKTEAETIIGEADTVEKKAKAIYDWICENIAYDTTKQIHDAETCFKTKRGVCQAYSELFCYMAEAVGLSVDVITGKAKDSSCKIAEDNHMWVYMYTHAYDGILLDPTWGAGSVDGVKFIKSDDNSTWFDVSPYWMIFSHFPERQYWTKLDVSITEQQFKSIPFVKPSKETDGKDFLFECISQ